MSLQCQAHRLMSRAAIERFQEWIYHTDHPVEALISEGYFQSVHDRLIKGDVIEAYAVGAARTQHLRLLVSRSNKKAVSVAPFRSSHDIDGFKIAAASLQAEPASEPGLGVKRSLLELRHLRHGSYRIVNGDGDVVVGDIKGHAFGVDLFGRIQEGKLSIEGARREVERINLDVLGHAEHLGQRSA